MANGATYNPDHSRRGEREQGIVAGPGAWPPVGLRPPLPLIPKHKTVRGRLARWLDDGESWWSIYGWYAIGTFFAGPLPYCMRENIPAPWKKDFHRQERAYWPVYKAEWEARWSDSPSPAPWRPSLSRDAMLPYGHPWRSNG